MNKVQQEILKIYKLVKGICEKHNIPYYAIGGTAIGAIRHQGFIPWDDDIDIGILADDFERFKKACRKELPEPYEFKELLWIGGKIHNTSTTFLEAHNFLNIDNYYGVFVDIFPLIGCPNDPQEFSTFIKRLSLFKDRALTLDRYPKSADCIIRDLKTERRTLLSLYPTSTSNKLLEFSFGLNYSNITEGLRNPIIKKFEDTTIPVSSTYDKDLTELYGDYMTLPPKSERTGHSNSAFIDLNTPYKETFQKFHNLDKDLLQLLEKNHRIAGDNFHTIHLMQYEINRLNQENTILQQSNTSLSQQLQNITNSKGWRILEKLRKIKA